MTAPRYLLDTNVLSGVARGRDRLLIERFRATSIEEMAISALSLMEIEFGLQNNPLINAQRGELMRQLLGEIPSLPFDDPAARVAAAELLRLRRSGTMIGPYDLLIAATALAQGLIMVTANVGEFARLDGLLVENWSSAA